MFVEQVTEGRKEEMNACFGAACGGWQKGKLRDDGLAGLGHRIGGLGSPRAPTFEN